MDHLGERPFPRLTMEWRASAPSRPDSLALPAGLRIIEAAVHSLGEEAHWIGYAHDHKLPVHQGDQRIRGVAGNNGCVLAQTQRVERIYPDVIMRVGAAGLGDILELWSRRLIERPPFRTLPPRGFWPVERPFAFAPIEAGKMSAGQRHPDDAVAPDVHPAGRKAPHGSPGIVPRHL